jgi:hypothetical protein
MTSGPLTTGLLAAGAGAVAGVPVEPDRGEARRWLQDELADPVYAAAEPSLVERAVLWVLDRLAAVESPDGPGGLALTVLTVVVLAGVVALALRFAGPLRRRAATGRSSDVFTDQQVTAAEHRRRAEQAAQEARWSVAVQERFRAVVRSMEERVLLDPRPGRTAHEAATEAAAALPQARDALLRGAAVFDDVAYGERPGTSASYGLVRDLDDLLARSRPVGAAPRVDSSAVPL